uniref:Uncharacterized protein n=1 Tax=Tetraselmis sp. GSL018 TaxID=582737 RepID=A0A061QRU9_9CHLO
MIRRSRPRRKSQPCRAASWEGTERQPDSKSRETLHDSEGCLNRGKAIPMRLPCIVLKWAAYAKFREGTQAAKRWPWQQIEGLCLSTRGTLTRIQEPYKGNSGIDAVTASRQSSVSVGADDNMLENRTCLRLKSPAKKTPTETDHFAEYIPAKEDNLCASGGSKFGCLSFKNSDT